MTENFRRLAARSATALALAGALAACDNPVRDDDGHSEPAAVVVQDAAGAEIARATTTSSTGAITVGAGQTREVRVLFVDEAGVAITLDGLELSLRGTVTNPSVATFTKTGESAGRVTGVLQGNTSVNFEVRHGSHTDYAPRPITVTVTP